MNNNHFNTAARSWDTDETIRRNASFADAIKKYIPKEGKLKFLDFGCGTGLLSSHFIGRADSLVGIDTSTGMLEQFDLRFKNFTQTSSLVLNLEKEDFPSGINQFDVIMTGMAFHHLKNPLATLDKLKSHLSPKGQIFVIDLDKEDGTFHPDNSGMGVEHFGFSQDEFELWGKQLQFCNFHHDIIYKISKNNREYGIALSVYGN